MLLVRNDIGLKSFDACKIIIQFTPCALRRQTSPLKNQLGTVFKMHGIIMVPFATPDKPVLFKNINDQLWYPVFIGNQGIFIAAYTVPLPIIRISSIDIDRHAVAMHAMPVGAGDVSPGKGAAYIC